MYEALGIASRLLISLSFILFRLLFFLFESHKFISLIAVKCRPLKIKTYLPTIYYDVFFNLKAI